MTSASSLRNYKEEQLKSQVGIRKEKIQIRTEYNQTEYRKKQNKKNQLNMKLVEKIKKNYKPLARLIRHKKEKTQMTNNKKERCGLNTDFADLKE